MKYKILIIDDMQTMREEIKRVLQESEIRDENEYEFYEASGIDEANEALLKNQFDVVIVDMKLKEGQEGMNAIENHRRWNPSAVILVYTAYPTLQNCVKAVKWGAWNYIDKNDAFKEYRDERGQKIPSIQFLSKSVREGLADRFSQDSGPNSLWLQEHMPELIKKYGGKKIAILDEEIIGVVDEKEVSDLNIREESIKKGKKPYYLWVPQSKEA